MTAFFVSRERDLAADSTAIRDLLDDFRKWLAWSPWEHTGLCVDRRYFGAPSGAGAEYTWRSHEPRLGSGSMKIVDSTQERVELALEHFEPLAAHSAITFALVAAEAGTRLTWAMTGKTGNPTMSRAGYARFVAKREIELEHGLDLLQQIVEV